MVRGVRSAAREASGERLPPKRHQRRDTISHSRYRYMQYLSSLTHLLTHSSSLTHSLTLNVIFLTSKSILILSIIVSSIFCFLFYSILSISLSVHQLRLSRLSSLVSCLRRCERAGLRGRSDGSARRGGRRRPLRRARAACLGPQARHGLRLLLRCSTLNSLLHHARYRSGSPEED